MKEVYKKELSVMNAGKDFETRQTKLVKSLHAHKQNLEESGFQAIERRTFSQPFTDKEVGTVHFRGEC